MPDSSSHDQGQKQRAVYSKDLQNSTYQTTFDPRVDNIGSISKSISAAQSHIIEVSKEEIASDIVEVDLCSSDHSDLTPIDLPGIQETFRIRLEDFSCDTSSATLAFSGTSTSDDSARYDCSFH